MAAQTPRILKSPLTNHWYVVTRYREREALNAVTGQPSRYFVAYTKHDVTDQMDAIFAALQKPVRRKKVS